MHKPYFQQLGEDFHALGLMDDHDIPGPETVNSWMYEDAIHMLGRTKYIGSGQSQERLISGSPEVVTRLAQVVLTLCRQEVSFDRSYRDGVCGEAEWRLARNIADESVRDPVYRSPVIVTRADEPIAIIKNHGENTCYGLTTSLVNGLVEGAFSTHSVAFDPESLPRTSQAWSIDINEVGMIAPKRFSMFVVPVKDRIGLDEPGNPQYIRSLTHDYIKRQAERLLKDARPVTADELCDAQIETSYVVLD